MAGHNLYMFKQKMSAQPKGTFAAGRDFAWTRQDTKDFKEWYQRAKEYKDDFFLTEVTLNPNWLEDQL